MAINNNIVVKSMSSSTITSETISEVWEFFEEAFSGYEGVSFETDTIRNIFKIYLDYDKKMYITIRVQDSGTGAIIEYWLGSEKCAYTDSSGSNASSTTYMAYLRTVYGIGWTLGTTTISTTSFNYMTNFFTLKSDPVMIVGVSSSISGNSSTHYIISPLHDAIEGRADSSVVLGTTLGGQRFAVCNAYACDVDINIRHLFRVLGLPSSSYSTGRIMVRNKRMFYCNRYALEYEEE